MSYRDSMASILAASPVIPVVTISDVAHAVPLAKALVRGGVRVVEVTLRTPAALKAIEAIASGAPDILLGAGTVVTDAHLRDAEQAGAAFAISPGSTPALLAAAQSAKIPFLPGVATPSEIMRAIEAGYDHLKFFPAAVFGGTDALKAFSGPFPTLRFCPTGGISAENAMRYLALPNVVCVGGSWLTPAAAVAAGNWAEIERLARDAVASLSRPRAPIGP
jgi:2-dehydro-3-deoxyphosphogluconate aldolase / (4S)-4-hydroxy-2-oxoglutarate aldolase